MKGEAIIKPPSELLTSSSINSYTLIISNQQSPELNLQLSKLCESLHKPVIFVNTYGFYGYVRNQSTSHEVYENKELKKPDLRLAEPFQALQEYVNSFELEKMLLDQNPENINKIVYVPYNAIIISAAQAAKSNNTNTVRAKIREWKQMVNADDLDNFDEAIRNVYRLGQQKKDVLAGIEQILQKENVEKATKDSSPYWIFCKALKHYM